jgi:6-phosphogluconate dehydrogenase (decarboxylating)
MENQMQLGMIGLGRMGASIVRRLIQKGHDCVVHDAQTAAVAALRNEGADAFVKCWRALLSRISEKSSQLAKVGPH